ncbi:hypothetical protein HB780_05995 (plasmid) [Rhizobium lusitanum]|uniref:hypothetical protein n=1 Tax=Rhizobium lusitanum TaxID=293958 RepID=UPI001611B09C|nr:hypothetical protein [Rhizobium lusitanum]QND45301.1 hypothetical protein HB780_05995 [Rhizobium lusitanum]
MTVATWPIELPKPERESWQSSPQESRLKRNNEAGPPSYRSRFSSVADQVSLSILVDRNGKAIFDRFHRSTTSRGSKPFYMPDPTTDGWKLYAADGRPLLTAAGRQILLSARWLCMFGDTMPAEAIVGVEFRKSFSVWVMP